MSGDVAAVWAGSKRWTVVHGDLFDVLPTLPDNSIDSCVCDPPYELTSSGGSGGGGFMGKAWDGSGVSFNPETWRQLLRVMKPGAHLLAFGGTRTYHRIACAIEDAGFEIRDSCGVFSWIFGSGFPKSTRLNLDPRFCQCAVPAHSDEYTDPEQSPGGHTDTAAVVFDGDRSLEDAQHSTQKDQDSLDGYPPGRGSNGARPHQKQGAARASSPSLEYALEHIRSGERDGAPAFVSSDSPSPVQCSSLLSSPDLLGPSWSVTGESFDTPQNTMVSASSSTQTGSAVSALHTQHKVSQSSASGQYGSGFPPCPVCKLPNSNGIGSALKPAFEPVIVARKPLDGTLVANALKYGTGGINIDACRVATDWKEPDRPESWAASGHSDKPDAEKIAAPPGNGIDCHPGGRWPTNLVFVHHSDCKRVGSRTVKTSELLPSHTMRSTRFDPSAARNGAVASERHARTAFGEGGTETVAAYLCHESCHVRRLEEQSGVARNGGQNATSDRKSKGVCYGEYQAHVPTKYAGDTGTAARFFPQFEIDTDALFQYVAKAGRAERELGCERLPARSGAAAVERVEGSAGVQSPRAGAGRTADKVRNNHPTVKPVDLLRWLVRLVTPRDGVCLDLFCGSGSTGIAAVLEEKRFIGIELNDSDDEPYVRIARARINYYARAGVQRDLFSEVGT